MPRMSDLSQGPGWWLASDGKWYAPELHPDYKSPSAAGWWQASDGGWYPPEQRPDAAPTQHLGASGAAGAGAAGVAGAGAAHASEPEGMASPANPDDGEANESPNAEWRADP